LPSLFFGMGYDTAGRSIAMSPLSEKVREWNPRDGRVSSSGGNPVSSAFCAAAMRRVRRFMFDRLGSPKSSPSSSSYPIISSSSAFQSSLVVDRKLM
jgi:hypothetical protein